MKIKKIFLTGGSGMVGRNILEHPLGSQLTILSPSRSQLNLFDYNAIFDWLKKEKPDAVIHAAGRVGGIHANMANPVSFLTENVDIGKNLILAAKSTGIRNFLNLGSSCMYPRDALNPLKESSILNGYLEPTNEGYALAKIFSMRLCEYIRKEDPSFLYKTIIPCNLYGRYDKFDPRVSHLIPAIIHKLQLAKNNSDTEVEIWGDGKSRREFMFATDLAEIILEILQIFESIPDVMNVGLGFDHSIDDYYETAANVMGFNGTFSHNTNKPSGMARKLVDISKQKNLGLFAKTNLKTGIELTYKYYLQEQQRAN
jgi:GDP-L-fucose synthase